MIKKNVYCSPIPSRLCHSPKELAREIPPATQTSCRFHPHIRDFRAVPAVVVQ